MSYLFMLFDLEQRTASLSVGEFSEFTLGPRDASGAPSGLWRAQLGTHWHNQLRAQTTSENSAATFEIPINGKIFHRGWTITLTGRIDQIVPEKNGVLILREIKTVTRPIPADESELRAEYPAYFVQLASYLALHRIAPENTTIASLRGELQFLEVSSGLAQTVTLSTGDDAVFKGQLERVTEFLDLRLRARERLRNLTFRAPFAELRPGQETTEANLRAALAAHPIVLFEAPTGFGKTGVLLELALSQMRTGRFERLIYLTSKATGQIQVTRTLDSMTSSAGSAGHQPGSSDNPQSSAVTTWLMRPKREHCIHTTFNCSRDVCPHLADLETRWPKSGLARFYLLENLPRDIETLRAAGREVRICPYEITRAALPFNDVWVGDYNYIFAPANRGIFTEQPGYDPARTLLIIDEAHNLPSRVADNFSHAFSSDEAGAVMMWFHRVRAPAPIVNAWRHWEHFLSDLKASGSHSLATEEDARDLLKTLATQINTTPLDHEQMPPEIAEQIWQIPSFANELAELDLPRLWWSPSNAQLVVTCLDAAEAIGPVIREFGAAVLASATLSPADYFATACGLDEQIPISKSQISAPEIPKLGELTKRDTKKLFAKLTSGSALLALDETRAATAPELVRAVAPWRDGAFDTAIDVRVDTTYQQRGQHMSTTAATIAALAHAAPAGNVAVFFPSYAYAENLKNILEADAPFRVHLQPRLSDLAAQNAWVEQVLTETGVLLLVLGSSFSEGIDLLGGRISHAMVVGPALPEVNAVQRARLATHAHLGRDAAARRVYQIPGIQKVNQGLGRLVRAPGQRAKILLHCRRFADKSFHSLLASEYQTTRTISNAEALATWLAK